MGMNYPPFQAFPRLSHWLIPVALLMALALAYLPGMHGPFVFDDFENITLNPGIALQELDSDGLYRALMSNQSDPFRRPLASLSFALNHYFSGGFENTFSFKTTNLVIHGINALLFFVLALKLTSSPALKKRMSEEQRLSIAALAAGIWALHPIQLTSVLYVVQRMNSLSALFVLAGLLLFLRGRLRLESEESHAKSLMISGLVAGMLGITAKENAILLPFLVFSIEITLFSRESLDIQRRKQLLMVYGLSLALPAAAFLTYLLVNPEILGQAYATRTFTPYERLLTQSRVLWMYLGLLLWPRIDKFGLFHDDIASSTGLFQPLSTLFAVLGWFVIVALALLARKKHPVAAFSVLWFLAGHLLESTILDLEIAFEHRNYLPSYGIIFSISYFLVSNLRRLKFSPHARKLIFFAIVCVLAFITWNRAHHWSAIEVLARTEVTYHPRSIRANDMAARVSLEMNNDILGALKYTTHKTFLAPEEAGGHIELQILLIQLSSAIQRGLYKSLDETAIRADFPEIADLLAGAEASRRPLGTELNRAKAASERIAELLRTRPVTVHTIVALEYLRSCLRGKDSLCASLNDDAEKWYAAALSNPKVSPHFRAIILRNAALHRAGAGEYAQAVHLMKNAIHLAPDQILYRIDLAEYLARMSRLTEAKQQLAIINDILSGNYAIDASQKIRVQQLRQFIDGDL